MKQYRYFHLDVFTDVPMQGNPLAVFDDAAGLSSEQMQAIAGELNLSETVFLTDAGAPEAVRRARIFTPRRELDFAGHPTIGVAFLLRTKAGVTADTFTVRENVGDIPITAETASDGNVLCWLTTPKISFADTLEREFCAKLLNLEPNDLCDIAPQFVSAGSPLLFICVRSPETVDRAQLQTAYLPGALGSVNSVGTFVFSMRNSSGRGVYSRMFAPQTGIPEDPATGGATGPLAAYMMRNGLLPQNGPVDFTSEQGVKMGRRSVLHVRIRGDEPGRRIEVGGSAVILSECLMNVAAHE